MSRVTNTQVKVKYRRNVGSLSIDMLADNRTTTLGRHIDRHIGRVSVDLSTDARPICRPIYRATHLGRHMSTNISVDIWPICRPICRSTAGRYVDRYVGRGVHKMYTWSYVCLMDFKSMRHYLNLSGQLISNLTFLQGTCHLEYLILL